MPPALLHDMPSHWKHHMLGAAKVAANAMGDDVRAPAMYEIALSLVEARGVLVSVGLTSPKEYRVESLIVRYQPTPGWLEVWSVGKVLSVKRHNEALRVLRYRPGPWEQQLIAAAQTAQRK